MLCCVALGMTLYKLPVYPPVGSDEWWLLGRSDSILHAFNFADTTAIDGVSRGTTRSNSPPMNLPLRYVIHKALGAGVEIDRAISFAQFVMIGLLFVGVAWRLGAPPAVALLGLPVFLLEPSVFHVARAVRYEQDIVFLGSLAVILSFLLPRPSRFQVVIAAVSGTMAGMVSVMHLFGIAFGASIGVTHAVLWLLGDRRRLPRRVIVAWLIAFAVPVALTGFYFATDPALNQGVDTVTRPRESEQIAHRMAFLRSLFPPPVPGLPDRVLETLNALRWGLMPHDPVVYRRVTALAMTALGVVAGAAAFGGLGVVVLRSLRNRWLAGRARLSGDTPAGGAPVDTTVTGARTAVLFTVWQLPVYLLALTAVRPHTDYAVYLHASVMLALFMLVATWQPPRSFLRARGSWLGARRHWLPAWGNHLRASAGWLCLLAVIVIEVAYLWPVLAIRTEPPGMSAGAQMQSMARLSEAVGLDAEREDGLPIYADVTSWAATGARHAPLFYYMILERAERRTAIDGIVFDPAWYHIMVANIAPATGEPIDPARRRERMGAVLDGLQLGGVLRIDSNTDHAPNIRLCYMQQAPAEPVVGIVTVDGTLTIRSGQPVADLTEGVAAGERQTVEQLRLDAGEYFALVSGNALTTSRIRATSGRQQLTGSVLDNFPQEHGGARIWVKLDRPADVRYVIETNGPAPSDVRLRVWRVR